MTGMDRITFSVGLRADDLDVHLVSERLGVQPTRAFMRGDEHLSPTGETMKRPWGVWRVSEEHEGERLDIDALFADFVARVRPWLGNLRAQCEGLTNSRCMASIHWQPEAGVGGYSLEAAPLRELLAGVDDVDFYYS